MNRLARTLCLASFAFAASGTQAQPPRPPAPPPPGEMLALAPGLDAAAVKDVRRIEAERRDALDQLAIRQRGERARIDENAEQQLRQRLGDEGYRNYLGWKADAARPPRPGRHPGGEGPAPRAGDGPAAAPADQPAATR